MAVHPRCRADLHRFRDRQLYRPCGDWHGRYSHADARPNEHVNCDPHIYTNCNRDFNIYFNAHSHIHKAAFCHFNLYADSSVVAYRYINGANLECDVNQYADIHGYSNEDHSAYRDLYPDSYIGFYGQYGNAYSHSDSG